MNNEILDELIKRKLALSHPALADYSLLSSSEGDMNYAPLNASGVHEEAYIPENTTRIQDPIQSGIKRGIEAARSSIAPTSTQDRRALGMALMNFAANFNRANQPNGFGGTLGAINQALHPALQSYINEQRNAESLNAKLLDMHNQSEKEKARDKYEMLKYLSNEEDRKLQRDALSQYRNQMLDMKRQDLELKKGSTDESKLTTNYKNSLLKDKTGSGKLIHQLEGIKADLEKYEKMTKSNAINPTNPYYGKKATNLREFVGYHLPKTKLGKKINEERLHRSTLDSKLTQFRINAERALKGGVLSKGMLDRFEDKNVLPNLNEPFDITKQKLEDLLKEARDINKISSYNLKHGKEYDLSNLDEIEVSEMSDEDLAKMYQELKK